MRVIPMRILLLMKKMKKPSKRMDLL
jgi:hypothetical protein